MAEGSDDDAVGFGRPPREHRFPKGKSGNKLGRPKGSRNLRTIAVQVLNSKVEVQIGGRGRSMSVLEASLHRTKVDALRGDKAALDRIFALARLYVADEKQSAPGLGPENLTRLTDQELDALEILQHRMLGEAVKLDSAQDAYVRKYGWEAAFWLNRPESDD